MLSRHHGRLRIQSFINPEEDSIYYNGHFENDLALKLPVQTKTHKRLLLYERVYYFIFWTRQTAQNMNAFYLEKTKRHTVYIKEHTIYIKEHTLYIKQHTVYIKQHTVYTYFCHVT